MVGNKPGQPFNEHVPGNELICPQCQYHLRTEPSISSPCPNCGFVGNGKVQDTQSDRKTVVVSDLKMETEPDMTSFHFDLVAEKSGSRIRIESEESELTLNRDHLDPVNPTISSEKHLFLRFHNGRVLLNDVSSNGSTFIQVRGRVVLTPGTKLVFGNQIYLFRQNIPGDIVQGTITQTPQFGGIKGTSGIHEFELFEERSGKKISLGSGVNTLNRTSLDPGNASISGKQHAILEYQDGRWLISDVSSNHATFIQVKSEWELTNGIKIIVGNTVFTFEC